MELPLILLSLVSIICLMALHAGPAPAAPRMGAHADPDRAARRLAGAVRYRTISHLDPALVDKGEFLALHEYLEKTYPRLHRALKRETVNGLSLLYTWEGSDAGAGPLLFMGHLDVVTVERDTEGDWTHPPFSGMIADGFVWGRGTLDVKDNIIGLMEAVECLLAEGYAPARTVYLAFGHDEEVLGGGGTAEVSRLLAGRGVRLSFVLDEGGFIRTEPMPGVGKSAALVGIAEKGYLTLQLAAPGTGGHAGMPARRTTVGRLAAALCRLEEKPFPARLTPPVEEMFRSLGAGASPGYRFLYSHARLFRRALTGRLAAHPESDAMIRTTTAPTMLEASDRENMLPQSASAVINFRILPGETRDSVTARVKKIIADPGITVTAREYACDPSPVSDIRSPQFLALKGVINDLFPDTVVTPFLVVGATDARHYTPLCDQVFRFNPARLSAVDAGRIHGTDERISIENLADFITFYAELIRRMAR